MQKKLSVIQAHKKLEKFLQKAKERNVNISRIKKECLTIDWFQENYTTVEKTKLILICPVHGEYRQTISQFLKGKDCRKCANALNSRKNRKRNGGFHEKPSFQNIQDKIFEINEKYNVRYSLAFNQNEFKKIYKNQKSILKINCSKHGIFETTWYNLRDNRLCPDCVVERKQSDFKNFIKKYKKYFRENEFDYSLITSKWFEQERKKFNGSLFNMKVPIIHKKCKKLFYQTVGNHFFNKHGCPHCDPSRKFELKDIKKIAKIFIQESKKLNQNIKLISKLNQEWMKSYQGYYKTKFFFKCKIHGVFTKNPGDIKNNKQYGCPLCNIKNRQSKGERKIEEILKKLKLNFKIEVKVFETQLRFDFYLPDYNLAIEYDGIQHFKNSFEFSKENLKKTKRRDFLKNKLCHIYKINLIRIPYWEYNNLENYLIKLLKRERVLK